jgi:hypothetical protein
MTNFCSTNALFTRSNRNDAHKVAMLDHRQMTDRS